jgi:DNA-binding transcriptional MerR regulator/effector-binding domain-containing protein
MEMYTIGQISSLFGMSKQTLRYYDKIDLLKPSFIDESTGYRYYEYSQFHHIGLILSLRQTGLPITDIKDFLSIKDTKILKEFLLTQKEKLDNQLREIEVMKDFTSNLYDNLDMYENFNYSHKEMFFAIKTIPARHLFKVNFEFDISQLYQYIKTLNEIILLSNDSNLNFFRTDIALLIDKEKLISSEFATYTSIATVIKLKGKLKSQKNIYRIPKGEFVYTFHYGIYKNLPDSYGKLMEYIKNNNYEITGDSIEISHMNIRFTDDPKQFITEIQIPVEKK